MKGKDILEKKADATEVKVWKTTSPEDPDPLQDEIDKFFKDRGFVIIENWGGGNGHVENTRYSNYYTEQQVKKAYKLKYQIQDEWMDEAERLRKLNRDTKTDREIQELVNDRFAVFYQNTRRKIKDDDVAELLDKI